MDTTTMPTEELLAHLDAHVRGEIWAPSDETAAEYRAELQKRGVTL